MTRLVSQQFRHIAARNLLGQTLSNSGLADTGFANQDWIVLCSSAKHLNDPLDFIAPANYRIEFVFLCQIGQITAKRAECRRLDVFLRWLASFLVRLRGREIWIKLFEDLVACAFDIEFKTFQNSRSDSLALPQKSKQNVFGPDVRMIERLGFLARERQHFFDARSVRNVPDHLGFRS